MTDVPGPALFRVGLTGNIASGKSAVADVWRALGAAVVDADELARRAVAPGTPGLAAVAARFGGEVLAPDGGLDRAALRRRVFANPTERQALEALTHPEVERLRRTEEARLGAAGHDVVVHMVPLLFEVGRDADMNLVVFVDAPEAERLRRLVELRGLPEAEALAMMGSQGAAADKAARADLVVPNDGTLEELRARAVAAWRQVERQAAAHGERRGAP
ncbi:MAG: dephospho-CoA kinase [Gemmatimonadota bacterium]